MICPQCATRNELGARRCASCGHPFTRDAIVARSQPQQPGTRRRLRRGDPSPLPAAGGWDAAATPARATTGRGGSGCLLALLLGGSTIAGLVLAAYLAMTFYVKPMVRDAAVADLRDGVSSEVSQQISEQLAGAPEGEIVISEAEVNQRLDATGNLGPLDSVDVRITPAGIEVALGAYGLDGTYQAQVVEENGSVALTSGSLDGPLALVVPDGELEAAVNREIAAAIAAAGYQVEHVALSDGAVTLVLAQ